MPLFTGNISYSTFLREYWRQKPCLFRDACSDSLAKLGHCTSTEQLLGLASQDSVESRLISSPAYDLRLGPFQLDTIPPGSLLMIQGLELHFDEINQLLIDDFSFLPRWKIEDVMASMGHTGTSCGAHFDHYDVFLLQVSGKKEWRLDDGQHSDQDLDHLAQVRLLEDFSATLVEDVGPGDILYIPPGVGHWGIALDTSVTLSIGVRNPTLPELVSHIADRVMDTTDLTKTLDDCLQGPDGGITSGDIENLRHKLADNLLNPTLIADWYGSYLTEPREPELIPAGREMSTEEVILLLSTSQSIFCTLPTRLAFHENADEKKRMITIFINGEAIKCDLRVKPWMTTLCNLRRLQSADIPRDDDSIRLVKYLFSVGAINIVNDEQTP